MAKDIIVELLGSSDNPWIKRALTDRSCKNSRKYADISEKDTNYELATLGDSVLRMCLTDIFLDNGIELSNLKQGYESNRILVTVIGKHYDILKYLIHNEYDDHWPADYGWNPHGNKQDDPVHKHIATAMEALLGAVYRTRGLRSAKAVVNSWIKLVDSEQNPR